MVIVWWEKCSLPYTHVNVKFNFKMQRKPLVSILIASYNKEKFVKRCINSCRKQNYSNIEIIFFDDGSLDNSYEIAKKFKDIKVFKNKKKKNFNEFNTYYQINTYNEAFKKSKGKYIFLLDSDDFFKKNKVKEVLKYFQKNPACEIVFDLPVFYYHKKKKINSIISKNFNFNQKKNIWPRLPLAGSCIAFKRDFYRDYSDIINIKNFSMITLDFRLLVISNSILNNLNIIKKNLTFYYQDINGETYSKFRRFNQNWWSRRLQAHQFVKKIIKNNNNSIKTTLDFYITLLVNKFFYLKKLFKL